MKRFLSICVAICAAAAFMGCAPTTDPRKDTVAPKATASINTNGETGSIPAPTNP